jgi:hypothetical protein
MSPLFPPKWVIGLPDTVVRISQQSNILFDETVTLLESNGYNIIQRKQTREINYSLKAWQTVKFFGYVFAKKYVPKSQYEEFNFVYLRSLFEDEAPDFNEVFMSICERYSPYQNRYSEDISLFDRDLSIHLTGSYDSNLQSLISTITNHATYLIYLGATILFKDKRNEAEIRKYLESFL